MWSILKAEWSAGLFTLLVALLSLFFLFPLLINMEGASDLGDPLLTHLLAVVMMCLLFIERISRRRTRLIHALPLSARRIAVTRLLFQLFYWLGAVALYAVALYMSLPSCLSASALSQLAAMSATLLCANALISLMIDVITGFVGIRRWQVVILCCLSVFILAVLIFTTVTAFMNLALQHSISVFIKWFHFYPAGMALQHIVAVFLSLTSCTIFQKRNSYLL